MKTSIDFESLLLRLNRSSSQKFQLLEYDMEANSISFPLSNILVNRDSSTLLIVNNSVDRIFIAKHVRTAMGTYVNLMRVQGLDIMDYSVVIPCEHRLSSGLTHHLSAKCIPVSQEASILQYFVEFDILPSKLEKPYPTAYNTEANHYMCFVDGTWKDAHMHVTLSPNEREYFFISASGRTISEASEELAMSVSYVKKVRRNVISKFQASNLSQALKTNDLLSFIDVINCTMLH